MKSDEDPVQSKNKINILKRERKNRWNNPLANLRNFLKTQDCKRMKDEKGEHWMETLT